MSVQLWSNSLYIIAVSARDFYLIKLAFINMLSMNSEPNNFLPFCHSTLIDKTINHKIENFYKEKCCFGLLKVAFKYCYLFYNDKM